MSHRGNDAQCQQEAGIALQGSSAKVFWAHLFPLLSPVLLVLSELVLANALYIYIDCVGWGFKLRFYWLVCFFFICTYTYCILKILYNLCSSPNFNVTGLRPEKQAIPLFFPHTLLFLKRRVCKILYSRLGPHLCCLEEAGESKPHREWKTNLTMAKRLF